jgi:hypothetical protein
MSEVVIMPNTMTSLQIAEVTGKPHNDVLKAIRKMEPAWEKVNGGKFSLVEYRDQKGEHRPCYELTKTECLYIATKFNDEARAKLVLRWEELEHQFRHHTERRELLMEAGSGGTVSMAVFADLKDKFDKLSDFVIEQSLLLARLHSALLPEPQQEAQAVTSPAEKGKRAGLRTRDRPVPTNVYTSRELSIRFNISVQMLNRILTEHGIIYRRQAGNTYKYQVRRTYVRQGYAVTRLTIREQLDRRTTAHAYRWTDDGLDFITSILADYGIHEPIVE